MKLKNVTSRATLWQLQTNKKFRRKKTKNDHFNLHIYHNNNNNDHTHAMEARKMCHMGRQGDRYYGTILPSCDISDIGCSQQQKQQTVKCAPLTQRIIQNEVDSRPTTGRLVRGLDDQLSVGLLADRQE